jgi:O-antigen/teichoic acid export membrane protein
LFGEQKVYLTNLITLCSTIAFALMAWQALEEGYGIMGLAIANLISGFLENGAYLIFAILLVPNLKFSLKSIDRAKFKTLLSFSSAQFVSNLSTILAFNSDLIIIKLFMSLESVGYYAIPLKIVSYGFMVIKQFTSVLTPVITDMHVTEQVGRLRSLFLHGTKYSLIVATAFAVPGIIFASEVITLWVGASFAAPMGVLMILLLAMWLTSIHLISADILQLSGYHQLLAKYAIIVIVVHLITSVSLVMPLGLVGVALGTLTGSIVGFLTDFKKVCALYQIKAAEFNQKILSKLIVPVTAQCAVLLIMKDAFPAHNLFELFLINIPGIICYSLGVWFFSLNDNEKVALISVTARQ